MNTKKPSFLFFWLIMIVILAVFAYLRLIPGGQISYTRNLTKNYYAFGGQGFISQLSPAERLDLVSGRAPKIIADPVYFSLFTPRAFSRAKVTIKYRSSLGDATPLIELGVLNDKSVWQYQTKPLVNTRLDELPWFLIQSGDLSLWQKHQVYQSLPEFLTNLPNSERLALYNYSLVKPLILSDYQPYSLTQSVAEDLRASYQFYTYLGPGEELNFDFYFYDLNQNYDLKGDGLEIVLFDQGGQIIKQEFLSDDGQIEDSGQKTATRHLSFKATGLKTGVYRLALKTNDDIVTEKIMSRHSKLAFINKLWLSSSGRTRTVYTAANNLTATAFGPGAIQDIIFDRQLLSVKEAYQQFSMRLGAANSASSPKEIIAKANNIILENNGLFSFSSAAYFNPDFKKVDLNWRLDDVDYVLASYRPQAEASVNNWQTASLEFDLNTAYRENKKYSFMISVPGLYAVNQGREAAGLAQTYLEIESVNVELSGKSLATKLFELWSALIN